MKLDEIKRLDLYENPKKQNSIVKFIFTFATKLVYGGDKVDYKFERMETSKLALHKAALETKRAIGG